MMPGHCPMKHCSSSDHSTILTYRALSFTALTPGFFCAPRLTNPDLSSSLISARILRGMSPCSLPPLLPFLDPGPGIAQRHSAVEHQRTGACIKVNAEIALALELVPTARRRPGETGLKLASSQHFQGLWIQ